MHLIILMGQDVSVEIPFNSLFLSVSYPSLSLSPVKVRLITSISQDVSVEISFNSLYFSRSHLPLILSLSQVKVRLIISMGQDVSVEIPFTLTHPKPEEPPSSSGASR